MIRAGQRNRMFLRTWQSLNFGPHGTTSLAFGRLFCCPLFGVVTTQTLKLLPAFSSFDDDDHVHPAFGACESWNGHRFLEKASSECVHASSPPTVKMDFSGTVLVNSTHTMGCGIKILAIVDDGHMTAQDSAMQTIRPNRGGARPGAGCERGYGRYGKPTVPVRIPVV
jgi:hypothetical protein